MAEERLLSSSSSRPGRAPQRSSHAELLQTIAELRERKAAAAAASTSLASHSQPRADATGPDCESTSRTASQQNFSSSSSSFTSSRRRRLHKVGSQHAQASDNSREEIEDWDDIETDEKPGVVDDLIDGLDRLSIAKPRNVHATDGAGISSAKEKIVDCYAALTKEPDHADTHTGTAQNAILLSDSESLDEVPGESRFDDGDLHEETSKSTSVIPRRQTKGNLRKQPLEGRAVEVLDLEDEKENLGVEPVIFSDGKKAFKLPGKLLTILYPHQREGLKWLWALHIKGMGGILGDDMGLGKTMQIAAFLAGLFASRLIMRALVVAPKTLIAHWAKELAFVGLRQKTKDFSGTSSSQRELALQYVLQVGGILLTTYDVVRNNWQALRGDLHGRDGFGDLSEDIVTWDYMVLDEGHLIKNPSTQRAKSLKEIPCAHRIVLSGTPIQNNLREMWALFDFCCPDLLGDRKEFKARYEDAILSANSKDSTDRQKRVGSAVAQELRKRIAPFFLRRMKSEVFPECDDPVERKLSRKIDIIVWLKLTKRQRELYTAFLESKTAHQSLEGSALAALTVLKKICDHPSLLTQRAADDIVEGMESMLNESDAAAAEAMSASIAKLVNADDSSQGSNRDKSCKIAFLLTLLEKLVEEGHRTLIFAQTRKMLDIVQKEISMKRYIFRRIDGTMKASDREKYVQEFQTNPDIPVFLLTSKVGGLGLTLTAADRVIIVDPAWNPSTDNQSVDRAYRIGQKLNVIIYRLMTSGTIEEKIYRKQVFKGGLFKVATEHKEQFRYFSHQELQELLSLPKTGFDISLTQQQLQNEHGHQHESDEQVLEHIKFLESQDIAGVSHHHLLFSKQAPELPPPEDENIFIWDSRKMRYGDGHAQTQPDALGFPPHDWPRMKEKHAPAHISKEAEIERQKDEISANIGRYSLTLADKATVSKLPDNGENLRRKIEDLTNQLESLRYIGSMNGEASPTKMTTLQGQRHEDNQGAESDQQLQEGSSGNEGDKSLVDIKPTTAAQISNMSSACEIENGNIKHETDTEKSSAGSLNTKETHSDNEFDDVASFLAGLHLTGAEKKTA